MPGNGVPVVVQGASDPLDQSSVNFVTEEFFSLPNAVLSGNCYLMIMANPHADPQTTTLKNNAGSSIGSKWLVPTHVGTWWVEGWIVANDTAADQHFSWTTDHANAVFDNAPQQIEIANADQSAGTGAVNTSNTAAVLASNSPRVSLTTTVDGCLIYVFGISGTQNNSALTSISAIDGTWTLMAENKHNRIVSAYKVQATQGVISCGFDVVGGGPDDWTMVAVAIKPANAGTLATVTPRDFFKQIELRNGTASTWDTQVTPIDNLVTIETVSVDQGSGGSDMSISDDHSSAWGVRKAHAQALSGGTADAFVCDSLTPGQKLQITLTNANGLMDNVCHNFIMRQVIGGLYGTSAQTTGNQTSAGDLTTVSITPNQAPGVAHFLVAIDADTIHAMVGAGYNADQSWNDQANGSCGTAFSDNGTGNNAYTNTSQLTAVWSNGAPSGVGNWGAVAVSINPKVPPVTNPVGEFINPVLLW